MRLSENINAIIIQTLLDAKTHVSGELLSEKLGISRAAINKRIASLKNSGYQIESVTNKGYRLFSYPDAIDAQLLSAGLKTKKIGEKIIGLTQVGSTNEYAKKIAAESPEGTVVVADEQTTGKGRRGRSFHSEKGQGLFMSFILKPKIAPQKAPLITGIGAAAVILTLEEFGIKSQVKWPNDLLIQGKKVCGILTEMSGDIEQIEYVILGIGLNVRNSDFPEEIREIASSLWREGYEIDRQQLFWQLVQKLEELYMEYLSGGKDRILEVLRKYSCVLGKEIILYGAEGERTALAIDLDDEGALVAEIKGEGVLTLNSGEISIRERKS